MEASFCRERTISFAPPSTVVFEFQNRPWVVCVALWFPYILYGKDTVNKLLWVIPKRLQFAASFFFFPENCLKLFNSTSEILSPCLFRGCVFGVVWTAAHGTAKTSLFALLFFYSLGLLSGSAPNDERVCGWIWRPRCEGRSSSPARVLPPSPRHSHPQGECWWEPPAWSFKYAWQRVLIPASNICFELCGGQMARGDIALGQDILL